MKTAINLLPPVYRRQRLVRRRIIQWIQLCVRVVEDVAWIVPDSEVCLADLFHSLAALGSRSIETPVGFHADPNTFSSGVVAAFRDRVEVGFI